MSERGIGPEWSEGPGRPPWSTFRSALEAAGFRPTKTRGQNFLLDPNMARAIVRDARLAPGDLVLEVGAGCGFLSVELLARGVELVAVEIEPRLARIARGLLAGRGAFRMIEADVLRSKHELAPQVVAALPAAGPWHLVANLPYAITGPLLVGLARLSNPPVSQTVLIQREVADRLTAAPGTRAYGALTARIALQYEVRRVRAVGRELFWPRPRVQSAVVRLELRPQQPLELERFDTLVERLFQARRKNLLNALGDLLGPRQAAQAHLRSLGLDPGARPGELSPLDLDRLAATLP